jgi:hypothetical protein
VRTKKRTSASKTSKTKKRNGVDRGLLGAAQVQFTSIKNRVNKSRKALENDPIKVISEAVLQNLRLMKVFAELGRTSANPKKARSRVATPKIDSPKPSKKAAKTLSKKLRR